MQAVGFSINLLTLFALVLAIGIVVDDAIVVVEAVHAKMEEEHLGPMDAAMKCMKEIASAIFAITLVMSAVFVPVAFLSGPVGVFYRQFSLTLAIAIVISGINALTLTPALCALLLKPHGHGHGKKNLLTRFFSGFNRGYDNIASKYNFLMSRIVARRLVTVGLLVAFIASMFGLNKILPTGFIPTEDQNMVYVNVVCPPGATVDRTDRVLNKLTKQLKKMPQVETVTTLAGYSLLNEVTGATYGMAMINLKSWDERKESLQEIMDIMNAKADSISDAEIEFFPPPTVPGFGNASGFELRIMDKTKSDDLNKLATVNQDFLAELNRQPEIGKAISSFNPNFPQYLIHVDYDQAARRGITVLNAMQTLQTYIGSFYASNFIRFGRMYKVMVQAQPDARRNPEDLLALHVKNNIGEMVPYSAFVRLERVYGPDQISRYNMYTSALINGDAAPGYSTGQAIEAVKRVAEAKLPKGFAFDWSGMTREQVLSGNETVFIFSICLIFVYLILAGQYESFILPLPVLLSLPVGMAGAYGFLLLTGLENNIYAQVALVMLIGLLGKNAILIIEFANQRRAQGLSLLQATLEGASARLRPILMTSFAFVAGLIPLTIATGAGALGNRSIGTAAAGGMFIGTVFGLLIIPGLYYLFAGIGKRNTIEGASQAENPNTRAQEELL
jgi:hydrophobe/amphiphile efflux-1 (HAE1) family protein